MQCITDKHHHFIFQIGKWHHRTLQLRWVPEHEKDPSSPTFWGWKPSSVSHCLPNAVQPAAAWSPSPEELWRSRSACWHGECCEHLLKTTPYTAFTARVPQASLKATFSSSTEHWDCCNTQILWTSSRMTTREVSISRWELDSLVISVKDKNHTSYYSRNEEVLLEHVLTPPACFTTHSKLWTRALNAFVRAPSPHAGRKSWRTYPMADLFPKKSLYSHTRGRRQSSKQALQTCLYSFLAAPPL